MDQFFNLKSMLYVFSGAVSAVFFCFTKQPVMNFFYQLFMGQHFSTTMIMVLLVLMQIAYAGFFMGLSMALVNANIKD